MPNDGKEQDRLDLLHYLFQLVLDNNLYLAPVTVDGRRILDVGTGTGIWAIDLADLHPSSQIIGNDLSPIQPSWVPPNLQFEIDDVEDRWTHRILFDFIHCRCMAGSILDWPGLLRQCHEWVPCQPFHQ